LLAVGIVHVRTLDRSLLPWIIASQTIPILAIAPMIIVVLGNIGLTGLIPKSLISMYLCFFPVTIGMVKGLRSPDPLQLDLMRTYSATELQCLVKVGDSAVLALKDTSVGLLTGVTGVGPKVALAFLSSLTPDALRRSVVAGDVVALTVVPGVGKKVAQRVVLDLKDKLGAEDVVIVDGPLADVREALLALGLSQQEASDAMTGLAPNGDASVEDLLREALQHVGRV
jgi:hypothetical protein